ncbi:hypothetical protein K435DRAFT_810209 [Dendrothele bispora CBS 962.96]|uniref:Uncharacterized protein n=1 Tax=Dendrothele bispora (strain CBS 962.96) TaxID=1314807 RepID=A0A4S8KWW5_DENBC|nr:hypothetical protein K435DRAFT_810209 [Dendrothele bispora CBS 962.96]
MTDSIRRHYKENLAISLQMIFDFRFPFHTEPLDRFGGGSEMLREGKDIDRLWNILESHARMTDILAQVPWLSHFVYKCLTFCFAQVGVKWTSHRIKRGASTKDLWYHLRYRIVQEIGFEQISLREIVSKLRYPTT